LRLPGILLRGASAHAHTHYQEHAGKGTCIGPQAHADHSKALTRTHTHTHAHAHGHTHTHTLPHPHPYTHGHTNGGAQAQGGHGERAQLTVQAAGHSGPHGAGEAVLEKPAQAGAPAGQRQAETFPLRKESGGARHEVGAPARPR